MSDPNSNEFDAAKIIVETLNKLDKAQQERALRFASESLGLQSASPKQSSSVIAPAPHIGSGSSPQPQPQGRATDIKQFTTSKAPKSDQQFATVVAYYYRFEAPAEQRRETINAEVLSDAARLVVRKRPTRFALTNAKNQGYLDSAGAGEYRINTVGENLVAITLPGTGGEKGPRKARKATSKKKIGKKK
jgi:hypothetical protein